MWASPRGRKRKGRNTVLTSFCFPLLSKSTVWLSEMYCGPPTAVAPPPPTVGGNAGLEAGLVCVESCQV